MVDIALPSLSQLRGFSLTLLVERLEEAHHLV